MQYKIERVGWWRERYAIFIYDADKITGWGTTKKVWRLPRSPEELREALKAYATTAIKNLSDAAER